MKNNKGFTLVEVLLAMGLTVVLVAMVATVAFSAMRTVSDTAALNERGQMVDEVYGFIEKCLLDATQISFESGEDNFSIDADGHLAFKGAEIFDESLYRGCHLEVDLSGGETVTLTVRLTDDDGRAYTRSGSFRLLNTALESDGSFEYGTSSALTVYFNRPKVEDFIIDEEPAAPVDPVDPENPYPGNNGNGNSNGNTGNHGGNGGNNGNGNGNGDENGNGNNGGGAHVGPGSGNGNGNGNDKAQEIIDKIKDFFEDLFDSLL